MTADRKSPMPMNPIKSLVLALVALLALAGGGVSRASESGYPLDSFPTERLHDLASLQHGAKLFVNYCLNCHGAELMRYNRLRDIGLSEDDISKYLLFTGGKVGDLMKVALDPGDAKQWFGTVPPDLSVIARSRSGPGGSGADYLYTYLRTFYRDGATATGWNNMVFPTVAMPNALWPLQGIQQASFAEAADPHDPARKLHVFTGFTTEQAGSMSTAQFNQAVADLVAYMVWMAEPVRAERVRIGVWVLLFLGLFTVIAWRLNAAFWKDIK